jgi:hypothetical protein
MPKIQHTHKHKPMKCRSHNVVATRTIPPHHTIPYHTMSTVANAPIAVSPPGARSTSRDCHRKSLYAPPCNTCCQLVTPQRPRHERLEQNQWLTPPAPYCLQPCGSIPAYNCPPPLPPSTPSLSTACVFARCSSSTARRRQGSRAAVHTALLPRPIPRTPPHLRCLTASISATCVSHSLQPVCLQGAAAAQPRRRQDTRAVVHFGAT